MKAKSIYTICKILVSVLIITFISCDDSSDDYSNYYLKIVTNDVSFKYNSDNLPTAYIKNLSSETVYLSMSEYVGFERLTEDGWGDPGFWFTMDGMTNSFPLHPNDSINLINDLKYNYLPAVNQLPQVYRFKFHVAKDPEMKNLLPEEKRVSLPFVVEE